MKRQHLKSLLAVSVSLLAFVVYLSALQNQFVHWDDDRYIFENPHIRSLSPVFFKWAFFDFYAGNWHPLTWMSHALDYAVWGLNPLGHHLTNIILHAINTFLVVLLSMRLLEARNHPSRPSELTPPPPAPPLKIRANSRPDGAEGRGSYEFSDKGILIAAVATGLLFGLHPLHVESVAWVSERKDLLCALFFLLSVMSYMTYAAYKTYKNYILSLIFFVLALMSKPMAVTLPVVLLILDWYPLERFGSLKTFRRVFIEKLPFIALSLVSAVLTVLAQRAGGTIRSLEFAPLPTRMLVGIKALIVYLWKMIWPMDLIPFYPYPKEASLFSLEYLSVILLVIGVIMTCVIAARKHKLWLSALGYYVITLVPVLGIVQVGKQSMADRYMYLPSVGPFLLLGVLAAWVWSRAARLERGSALAKLLAAAVSAGLIISLSYLTFRQTGIWKDSIVFWSYVIEKEPETVPVAYNNRGVAYKNMGMFDKALADFSRAVALDPFQYKAYNNRGVIYKNMGLLDKAIGDYDKAIQINPDHAGTYKNRGVANFLMGRNDRALKDFDEAIFLSKNNPEAYLDRGTFYFSTGNYERAASDFQKACDLGSKEGCARSAVMTK